LFVVDPVRGTVSHLDVGDAATTVAVSPAGRWAAVGGYDSLISVDLGADVLAATATTPLPGDARLMLVGEDGSVAVVVTGGQDRAVALVAFGPDLRPGPSYDLGDLVPLGLAGDLGDHKLVVWDQGGAVRLLTGPGEGWALAGTDADLGGAWHGIVAPLAEGAIGTYARDGFDVRPWPGGPACPHYAWTDMENAVSSPDGRWVAWRWHTWDGTSEGTGVRVGRTADGSVVTDTAFESGTDGNGPANLAMAVDDEGTVRLAWGEKGDVVAGAEVGPGRVELLAPVSLKAP
jgi:hypothetical protein